MLSIIFSLLPTVQSAIALGTSNLAPKSITATTTTKILSETILLHHNNPQLSQAISVS
jgi:hypothetical protein